MLGETYYRVKQGLWYVSCIKHTLNGYTKDGEDTMSINLTKDKNKAIVIYDTQFHKDFYNAFGAGLEFEIVEDNKELLYLLNKEY